MVNMVSGWIEYCKYSRPYNGKNFTVLGPRVPALVQIRVLTALPKRKFRKYLLEALEQSQSNSNIALAETLVELGSLSRFLHMFQTLNAALITGVFTQVVLWLMALLKTLNCSQNTQRAKQVCTFNYGNTSSSSILV